MHANGDIERGYPPVLPLASRGALVGATPLLVTGTPACACAPSRSSCRLGRARRHADRPATAAYNLANQLATEPYNLTYQLERGAAGHIPIAAQLLHAVYSTHKPGAARDNWHHAQRSPRGGSGGGGRNPAAEFASTKSALRSYREFVGSFRCQRPRCLSNLYGAGRRPYRLRE